jgi:hypothetical protein
VHIGNDLALARCAIECFDHVQPVDNGYELMLQAGRCLFSPKTGKTKYGPGNICVSEFNSLFGQGNAKPVSAFALKPSRTLHSAVAVGVSLHHSHHVHIRADAIFDELEIGSECVEVDLGPGWPSAAILVRFDFGFRQHQSIYWF